MNLSDESVSIGILMASTEWLDGGTEAAPLGITAPAREPATETAPDPSWKAL